MPTFDTCRLLSQNLTNGAVTGCLTRTLPTVCSSSASEHDALVHAKPILIQVRLSHHLKALLRLVLVLRCGLSQGAWLAASAPDGKPEDFQVFKPAMEALLAFWDRPPRRDPLTKLRTW